MVVDERGDCAGEVLVTVLGGGREGSEYGGFGCRLVTRGKNLVGAGGAENSSVSPMSVPSRTLGKSPQGKQACPIEFLDMLEMLGTGRAAIMQLLQSWIELQ